MNKVTYSSQQATPAIKVGQFYRWKGGGSEDNYELYLVSRVRTNFVLICLEDGLNWADASENIEDVFDNSQDEFELITTPFTIKPYVNT